MPMNDSSHIKQITDATLCASYGALVRAGRNALGISQNGLAALLGVHRTTLVRLEQGTPPLRTGLCNSALEVLRQAGVECDMPQTTALQYTTNGVGLHIHITAQAIAKAQQGMEEQMTAEALAAHFLGSAFKPPLTEKPLRKK